MKEYYYRKGEESFGPFTLEQLKTQNISQETPVWSEGMNEWQPAGEVDALSPLFAVSTTSQIRYTSASQEYNNNQFPPKTYLLESILVTVFCCLPFGIVGIVNAANVESRWRLGDFEGSRRASNEAKKWMTWGLYSGLAVGALYFIVAIFGLILGS